MNILKKPEIPKSLYTKENGIKILEKIFEQAKKSINGIALEDVKLFEVMEPRFISGEGVVEMTFGLSKDHNSKMLIDLNSDPGIWCLMESFDNYGFSMKISGSDITVYLSKNSFSNLCQPENITDPEISEKVAKIVDQ